MDAEVEALLDYYEFPLGYMTLPFVKKFCNALLRVTAGLPAIGTGVGLFKFCMQAILAILG
jgi:hypothetical protein